MGVMIPLLLALASAAVQADVFDAWAADHNGARTQVFVAPSVPFLPQPAGHMEIARRVWSGRSGVALAIYDQGGGRILPLYIAADTDETGKATFVAWTLEPPSTGLAQWGQAADVGVTGIGLAAGLSEANPLLASNPALIAGAVVKLAAVPLLRARSIEYCYRGLGPVGSLGWGAAGYGAVLITSVVSGGVLPVVVGVGAAVATWPDSNERFWSCVPKLPLIEKGI